MAKSMTGYGRAEHVDKDRKFTVEIKSVNNRYLDINIRMPRIFNPFEADIKNELKNYITRGKVDVYIGFEDQSGTTTTLKYNKVLAGQYLQHLRELADDYGLPCDISATRLSSYPDVFTVEEEDPDNTTLWEPLKIALDEAAEAFLVARTREGDFITKDLNQKLDHMLENVEFISGRAPAIIERYQKQLHDKIAELVADTNIDDQRILQEVAIYSDKVCIDEELVRLRSHVEATRAELAKTDESVGRKLDFLAQEMNRESNTILSKTDEVESANKAVELKTEVEKIREQIQNLE